MACTSIFSPLLFFPLLLTFVLMYCNGVHLLMILRHESKCTRFASVLDKHRSLKILFSRIWKILFLSLRIPLNKRPDPLKSIYYKFWSFALRNCFLKKLLSFSESILLKSDPVWIILLPISSFCYPILCLSHLRCQPSSSSFDDKDHSRCFQEMSVLKESQFTVPGFFKSLPLIQRPSFSEILFFFPIRL